MKLTKLMEKVEEAKELCLKQKLGWRNATVSIQVPLLSSEAEVYIDDLGTIWIIGTDMIEDGEFTEE